MATTTVEEPDVLDALVDHLLTPESAARMMAFELPERMMDRLEVFREKAGEGELTAAERQEYEMWIDQMDTLALLKLKARHLLPKVDSHRRHATAGV